MNNQIKILKQFKVVKSTETILGLMIVCVLTIITMTLANCDNKTKVDNISKKSNLTEIIIDTTNNNDLAYLIFSDLSNQISDNYEHEYEIVLSWNKYKQTIYFIWLLEAEVNNGGYNQFYFNSSGQFADLVPDALKMIGAYKFAKLTEKANKIYKSQNTKITEHLDGTLEGFSKSYKNNPLNDLDDEFYKFYNTENLQKLQTDFIRKNKKEFLK